MKAISLYLTREDLNSLLENVRQKDEVLNAPKPYLKRRPDSEYFAAVYLSERNILSLLSKLSRLENGEDTAACIIKNDVDHKKYPCTARTFVFAIKGPGRAGDDDGFEPTATVTVYAVSDEDYYTDRDPGPVHPLDEPNVH
jgi:hypothetical protein